MSEQVENAGSMVEESMRAGAPPRASVLFVCTANRIRSPMAEALMRRYLAAHPDGIEWDLASAGTWAKAGLTALPMAQQVMAERGADLRQHRAAEIDEVLMARYHLVLVMEAGHKEALQAEFPQEADRVYLLSEMAGQRFSVADPIGGDVSGYRLAADVIASLIDRGAQRIRGLALEA